MSLQIPYLRRLGELFLSSGHDGESRVGSQSELTASKARHPIGLSQRRDDGFASFDLELLFGGPPIVSPELEVGRSRA